MEIPGISSAHRPSFDLPKIYIQGSNQTDRYRSSNRSSNFSSRSSPTTSVAPMPIPNSSRETAEAPPPLPPPRYPGGHDISLAWSNSHSREGTAWDRPSPSVNPESSPCGSFRSHRNNTYEERPDYMRHKSPSSTFRSISGSDARQDYPRMDEGYASLSGTSVGSNQSKLSDSISSRTGFQSSVHDKFRSNAQAYDKSLLQKLDLRRRTDNGTPPRGYPKSPFSSSLNDASPTSKMTQEHQPSQKPLSMPALSTRMSPSECPFSRWVDGGISAISPLNVNGHFGYRSPSERDEAEKSPWPYIQRSTSGSLSNSDDATNFGIRYAGVCYDLNVDADSEFPIEETSVLRRLRLDDGTIRVEGHSPPSAAGQKRRASSPPGEDGPSLHTVSSSNDLIRRRESASRSSPTPRFHSSQGSISSTASGPRNGSYTSSLSRTASSITTVSSYGRLSPGGLSPGGVSPRSNDGNADTPYPTSAPPTSSPRGSAASPIHRALPERPLMNARKSSDTVSQTKRSSPSKLQGMFMCECCPKKPKKFETEEELNAHEMEKQYECQYCKNRFKNKNEAERHQNSLHLRRHSWSCAAISGCNAAFHSSPTHPAEADTCGYCGDEFPRSGVASSSTDGKVATDHDWVIRVQHLIDVHKFGECNHAKKFFRADHFRQHLKHSHAGTSGKWTNMLENACMKDEPLPEPLHSRITEEDE